MLTGKHKNFADFLQRNEAKNLRISDLRTTKKSLLVHLWILRIYRTMIILKGQCHETFASGFFHESVSPQPQSIPLGPFRIFSKIRGDIRKSRYGFSRLHWYVLAASIGTEV